ncbi:hypothetical protein SSBR45G_52510 [Bradyrhizobium sp. SSBR45G]|uniref:hypothetical protein n=1 Tax=unclassified Bradyrhizobium TaxID=2631580 RepID=UPI002342B0F8|nr:MULTISPECIES: hypothetical protein [unclassified Bradyrhizobium]GLH80342.1 hypothetical protein SSBR45G_52510 [Bradyrhizobium sp. SSBR45G]GLH87836.1 hypothetical protein SSBR45R_52960 [Bradyrhizobium sp. SSBR45R]
MSDPQQETVVAVGTTTANARLGVGSWTIIVILVALLGASGFVAYLGWTLGSGADVPTSGYVSMALGVVASLAVGVGLMGLVFYSSRRGYDEPAVFITTQQDSESSAETGGDNK